VGSGVGVAGCEEQAAVFAGVPRARDAPPGGAGAQPPAATALWRLDYRPLAFLLQGGAGGGPLTDLLAAGAAEGAGALGSGSSAALHPCPASYPTAAIAARAGVPVDGHDDNGAAPMRLDFALAGPGPTHVTVHRHLDPSFALQGFRLNGRDVAYERTGSDLRLHLPALPAGAHCLELVPTPQAPARPYAPSRSQRISVAVRRALSELRDHVRARLPARR
jgi:hypothetical protein